MLIAPLPYDDAGRLVLIRQSATLAGQDDVGVSIKELYDYRERLGSFDALVEFHQMDFDLLRRGDPDRVSTGVVSHNFFDVLGVRPLVGRTFVEADDRPGAEAVLVLGHAYWQSRFGGDPAVIGQVLEMNDRPHTVIGVLPDTPLYPNAVDVYMPTSACPFRAAGEQQMASNRRAFPGLRVFGLLKRERRAASRRQRRSRPSGHDMSHDFPDVYRPETGFRADTLGVQEALTQNARPMLLVLLGITGLVLLLACANVANLTLARTLQREHERATRAALGAGRWSLLSQPLAESVIVALAGAVVGLVFAWATLDLLASFVGRFTSRAGEIGIDWTVLLFTIGISLVAGLLLGMLPALGSRVDLAGALKTGTKGGGGTPRRRLQHALVAGQVAVSVVLFAAAGLLLLSVSDSTASIPAIAANGSSRPRSSRTSEVPHARVAPSARQHVLERLRGSPGRDVRRRHERGAARGQAAGPDGVPNRGPHATATPSFRRTADVRIASPDYFATLGVPLLRGRRFGRPTARPRRRSR